MTSIAPTLEADDLSGSWPSRRIPETWTWVKFDVAFSDQTSSDRKLPQKDYQATGQFPVVDQGATLIGGWTDDTSLLYRGQLPVLIFGDHTRIVKFIESPFVQGADGVKVLVPQRSIIEPKFAYWALKTLELPDKGYSRHAKFLRASLIPIPPMAEQRRIVARIEALFARTRRARADLERVAPLSRAHWKASLNKVANPSDGGAPIADNIDPSTWTYVPFEQILDFRGGMQPPKETFVEQPQDGYVRLLQIRDFASDAKAVLLRDNLDGDQRQSG